MGGQGGQGNRALSGAKSVTGHARITRMANKTKHICEERSWLMATYKSKYQNLKSRNRLSKLGICGTYERAAPRAKKRPQQVRRQSPCKDPVFRSLAPGIYFFAVASATFRNLTPFVSLAAVTAALITITVATLTGLGSKANAIRDVATPNFVASP